MKRIIVYCLILLNTVSSALFAQSDKQAEQMIAGFIQSLERQAIKANFAMTITNSDDVTLQTQNGTFIMKGKMFSLDMEEMSIFFDGKTQWTYVPANNEVSITEPEASELNEINPIFILREYQNKCNVSYSKKYKTAGFQTLEMLPVTGDSDFSNIVVQFNPSADKLTFLKIEGNDLSIRINFSDFEKNITISNDIFVFNKNKYKDVFENDLR